MCLKIAFRYVDTYEQAREVTTEAFLKIFQKFSSFKTWDEENVEVLLKGWISRVVVNAAIDYSRRKVNHFQIESLPDQIWQPPTIEDHLDNANLHKELILKIKALPPAYRMVFNLYVIDEYSHPQIARMLGISVGTSKSNLSKARAYLRKAIGLKRVINI